MGLVVGKSYGNGSAAKVEHSENFWRDGKPLRTVILDESFVRRKSNHDLVDITDLISAERKAKRKSPNAANPNKELRALRAERNKSEKRHQCEMYERGIDSPEGVSINSSGDKYFISDFQSKPEEIVRYPHDNEYKFDRLYLEVQAESITAKWEQGDRLSEHEMRILNEAGVGVDVKANKKRSKHGKKENLASVAKVAVVRSFTFLTANIRFLSPVAPRLELRLRVASQPEDKDVAFAFIEGFAAGNKAWLDKYSESNKAVRAILEGSHYRTNPDCVDRIIQRTPLRIRGKYGK